MSNLYILLIASGALILLGVVVQGLWQSHKASRMLKTKTVKGASSAPNEPTWANEEGQGDEEIARKSPFYDAIGLPDTDFYTSLVDPLIDAVVEMELDNPILGSIAISATPATRRVGSKPLHFEGYNKGAKSWEPLNPHETYERIQVALQLANRSGALNEIEFSDFIRLTQNYADHIGGAFEAPDMMETVARAKELDQFANVYDAQLSIYLVSNVSAWSSSYLQQQAASLGFLPGSVPGRLVIPSQQDAAPPVITMSYDMQTAMADDPNSPLTNVTLNLDVAQTDRNEEPFKLLYEVIAALVKSLEASVVDEQGIPLNAESFNAIYKMLENIYDQMEKRGLNAGSSAARRLFS